MKNHIRYLVPVAALLLPVMSCNEDYGVQDWTSPKENCINLSLAASAFGESLVWPEGARIGVFCEQTGSVNVPVEISAASAGGETGEFYSDIKLAEGAHVIYIYYPYSENMLSTVLSGELPSAWSQAGDSYGHLLGRNLFCCKVEMDASAVQLVTEVSMEPVFDLAEISVSSTKYKGYSLDMVSISPEDGTALSGSWTYDMDAGTLKTEPGASVPLTLNVSGVEMGDDPSHIYFLTGLADDMKLNCTFSVSLSNDEGSIILTGNDILEKQTGLDVDGYSSAIVGDESVDLSDPDGDGVRETANCYIAGTAGQTYRFPATIMGNGYTTPADPSYSVVGGSAPGITPSVMAPASAAVLWQTGQNLITNVRLRNGYVYFDLPGDNGVFVPGNAVIAIYNGSGRILWSWHIWVTDADIDGNLQTWTVHPSLSGYSAYQNPELMDRNLGALGSSDWATSGTNASKGLFYQWGRKDPFIGPDNSSATTRVMTATYDANGNAIGAYSTAASFSGDARWTQIDQLLSREDIAAYPMTFISGSTNYFWLEDTAHDLWGLLALGDDANTLGHKTIYDPCPPGYRVMNPYAMTGVTSSVTGGAYKSLESHKVLNPSDYRNDGSDLKVQCNDNEIATLPACGLVYFEKGLSFFPFDRVGTYGYMWTTRMTDSQSNRAQRMHYDWNNFVSQEGAYASYGHGVRCEKIK